MTREEAQQAWEKMRSEIDETNWLFVGTINPQMVDIAIEALSAETRDRGEWIRWVVDIEDETGVSYIPHAKCSNCGTEQDSYTSQFINFCPNCGAYMAKENEE